MRSLTATRCSGSNRRRIRDLPRLGARFWGRRPWIVADGAPRNVIHTWDRNVALGLRWISADSIDSFTLNPADRYSVDVMQADVNVRF